MSECFCNVTAYELAYARAPPSMKALVMALFLFTTALSSALAEGKFMHCLLIEIQRKKIDKLLTPPFYLLVISPAISDPHLIWVWAGPAIALAAQTVVFWFRYRHLNNDEFMTYDDTPELKEKAEEGTGWPDAISESGEVVESQSVRSLKK